MVFIDASSVDDAKRELDRLLALERTVAAGPWISVKDRLPVVAAPGKGQYMLVRVNCDSGPRGVKKLTVFRRTSLAMWTGYSWKAIENSADDGISISFGEDEVTHWAELDTSDLCEPSRGSEIELSDEEQLARLKKYGAP
jgi:hypothetical protein